MKKIIILLLIISVSTNLFAQQPKKSAEDASFYLQKSKTQKTIGWIMLSGGTIMCAGGYVWFIYEGMQGDGIRSTKAKLAVAMFYGGGAAMLGSIPLFIAAARNKGIAMSLTARVKMETVTTSRHPSFVKNSYPALSLKFNF